MFWKNKKIPKSEDADQNKPSVNSEGSILKQDTSEKAQYSGVYMMWLMFQEKVPMPATPVLVDRLKARFGGVDVVSDTSGIVPLL